MSSHQSLLLNSRLTTIRLTTAAFIGGLVIASPVAFADEESSDETTWGLGVGAISEQDPYAGIDRENTPFPLFLIENRYISVFGPEIEFKLPSLVISDSQQLNFGIVAQYDESGYEQGDAPILNGMNEREGGFWAGANVEWENELFEVSAEWLTDVSGNSDGQRFDLGLEKTWEFGEHIMLTHTWERPGRTTRTSITTSVFAIVRFASIAPPIRESRLPISRRGCAACTSLTSITLC